jgi:hypothetical protein
MGEVRLDEGKIGLPGAERADFIGFGAWQRSWERSRLAHSPPGVAIFRTGADYSIKFFDHSVGADQSVGCYSLRATR